MASEDEPLDSGIPDTPEPAPTTIDPTRLPFRGLIGTILNGRYEIDQELKRGGMGVVYLAQDRQLHSRPVVVKVLLDEAFRSDYVVQKFRQEVEALSRIDHPGIVGVIDAGELPDGKPFIVMQYVAGFTLRSFMNPEGMDLNRVADLIKQIGRALSAAHDRGIFHRDLKPDNIMIQDLGEGEEQVKIIDFGVAKVKDSVIAKSTALNLSPGTVAYMAPEQLSNRPITAATDIFALGTIAYEMITGRKPFNPETGYELLQMQQSGVRIKPADLRPSLPAAAQEIVLKALSYNPKDRYERPRQFGDALSQTLLNAPVQSDEPRFTEAALPMTQLSSEVTPLAQASSVAHANPTIHVPFQQAPPASSSGARLQPTAKFSNRLILPLVGAGLFLTVLVALAGFYFFRPDANTNTSETEAPARFLNYGLTVQKMRDRKPYQEPFESSGQEIFENGWKFRMGVNSPQTGFLYLLNEGPAAGGEITLNLLFPIPSSNNGSAEISLNQKIETGWMVFDENQGTEKFWVVWSEDPVAEIEDVKGVMNPVDKGAISEPEKLKAVQRFLDQHAGTKPEVEKDKTKKQTNLKGKGQVLVHLMELEHR